MEVLAFLDLVNFHFQLQLEFLLKSEQPFFELLLSLHEFVLVVGMQHSLFREVLLLQLLAALDVFLLVLVVPLFEIVLHAFHYFNPSVVVVVLLGLGTFTVPLDLLISPFLLVLQVPDLLKINFNLDDMVFLHRLRLGLGIQDLQL